MKGFTLTELLVALALTLIVSSAIVALTTPAHLSSATEPDALDMYQRARIATGALTRDLMQAGAGRDAGPAAGPLSDYFAVILPRRLGRQRADLASVARADVISILYTPKSPVQTTLRLPLAPGAATVEVNQAPGCIRSAPACGLHEDMTVAVADARGGFDIFDVTQLAGEVAYLRSRGAVMLAYAAGAFLNEVQTHTYYLDRSTRQLRHYDGDVTDVPVVDRLTDMLVEYFGDPGAARRPVPSLGMENCLYDATGRPASPLAAADPAAPLVSLPLTALSDGPWCGAGASAFDADLLRVRRVRVTLRLAPSGTSARPLADYVVTIDVSPRNLNLNR